MEPYIFKECLAIAPYDLQYNIYLQDVRKEEDGTITAFYIDIKTVEMDDPGRDSYLMLEDLRYLEKNYGLDDTFSFEFAYREFEIYKVLKGEIIKMLLYALSIVTLVVLFITFDLRVTFIVVMVVSLVILYMTAICHYWGLQLNNFFAVNLTFALGIAVDYSVHIAHKYLIIKPPASLQTN